VRGREFVKVSGLELDPRGAALLVCAATGVVESGDVPVYAEDAAARAYNVGGQK